MNARLRCSWRTVGVFVVALVVLVLAPSAGAGAGLSNGGFENGLAGWKVGDQGGNGSWFVYSGMSSPLNGFPVDAPPVGKHAAVTDQTGPGAHVLYRKLKLAHKGMALSFVLYYVNGALDFCAPPTLDPFGGCNQQYRVDILRDGANPFSVDPGDVLMTLCQTNPSDPLTMSPTRMGFSLAGLKGTVILRFAEVDTESYFQASVDDVTLGVGTL